MTYFSTMEGLLSPGPTLLGYKSVPLLCDTFVKRLPKSTLIGAEYLIDWCMHVSVWWERVTPLMWPPHFCLAKLGVAHPGSGGLGLRDIYAWMVSRVRWSTSAKLDGKIPIAIRARTFIIPLKKKPHKKTIGNSTLGRKKPRNEPNEMNCSSHNRDSTLVHCLSRVG